MYLQKYSYLSSNSHKNTKLGDKLILSHRIFLDYPVCKWSHLSIHEYLWKPEKLERKLRKNGLYNSAAYCSDIQNGYQINIETKLFYSG